MNEHHSNPLPEDSAVPSESLVPAAIESEGSAVPVSDDDEAAPAIPLAVLLARAGPPPAVTQICCAPDPAWEGARVLVIGLGESGLAMAKWLGRCGATLTVLDTRAEPPQKQALLEAVPQARLVHASFEGFDLGDQDLLAWSPGVSIELGAGASLYQSARERGLPVLGELDFFMSAVAHQRTLGYQTKIIGVTGTNGKTTVTALSAHLCRAARVTVRAAGNIGPAMLDSWMDDSTPLPSVWVLELSSFQTALAALDGEHKVFDVATILNLSQDHLDWHASMASYEAAKRKLVLAAKVPVFSTDDDKAPAACVRFGPVAPRAIGDFGLLQDGPLMWLAAGTPGEETPLKRNKGMHVELLVKRLMPADALRIRGQHNHLNALAALALCRGVGLPLHALLHGLRDYRGEPHRCELVSVIEDVEYIDDSKGTNVGATLAGLQGLAKPCHLILGGEGKGQDFSPLLDPVRKYARSLLLIGRDAQHIAQALAPAGVETVFCDSLEAAVAAGAARARLGDVVLLSPACASFDMFRNYGHRAQVFCDAVRALAADRGHVEGVGA